MNVTCQTYELGMNRSVMILTLREQNILQLVYNGYSNKQIADELYISLETVKRHLSNIYKKLDVNNKIAALKKAGYL